MQLSIRHFVRAAEKTPWSSRRLLPRQPVAMPDCDRLVDDGQPVTPSDLTRSRSSAATQNHATVRQSPLGDVISSRVPSESALERCNPRGTGRLAPFLVKTMDARTIKFACALNSEKQS